MTAPGRAAIAEDLEAGAAAAVDAVSDVVAVESEDVAWAYSDITTRGRKLAAMHVGAAILATCIPGFLVGDNATLTTTFAHTIGSISRFTSKSRLAGEPTPEPPTKAIL